MSNHKPQHGAFCWNELMTPNVKKAKEFYTTLFGWETHDHPMDQGGVYTMIKCGGNDIGGIMQLPEEKKEHVPPHWMGYVNVDNLDAVVKKAESLGAVVKMPQTTAGEFGRFAVIQDPTGAHIALWESAKSC